LPVLPISVEIAVIALGAAYTAFSVILQRKLGNAKRSREIQGHVQALTKELNTMLKGNASSEEISRKQGEIMPLIGESMKMQFKPMLIILPVFFVVWYGVVPAAFGQYAGYTVEFLTSLDYSSLFFFTVLVLGFSSSIVLLAYDRKQLKKGAQQNIIKSDTG
jgi:uncharacterized membrane protein (DUF106 family)